MTQTLYPNDSLNYLGTPCGVILEELKKKREQLASDPFNSDLKGSIDGLLEQLKEVGYYVKH
jgi:hypothetical protein